VTTINQYVVHAEMLDTWKYKKLDETIQKRANEHGDMGTQPSAKPSCAV
jgi:bacterioferritin (cytochrome b1)